jgi:hypothetical protein
MDAMELAAFIDPQFPAFGLTEKPGSSNNFSG